MDKKITKTSKKWFWITLNKNYAMTQVTGWADIYYQSLLDFWYTIPITKTEYLIRANNSIWSCSRELIYKRKWHPFGRYHYKISFRRKLFLFLNYNTYWLCFYNCYIIIKQTLIDLLLSI